MDFWFLKSPTTWGVCGLIFFECDVISKKARHCQFECLFGYN